MSKYSCFLTEQSNWTMFSVQKHVKYFRMATNSILDTDSEDELPAGWEERVTVNGRVYYAK